MEARGASILILKGEEDKIRGATYIPPPLRGRLGGGLTETMKRHKHFPDYTKSLVNNARQLRRNMTNAERKLWNSLRRRQMQLNFRRQIPFHQYILDFYCQKANLVIEVDGSQHYTKKGIIRDKVRDSYLQQHGLKVLRFSDRDVLMNISGANQKIHEEIETPPQSSPKRGGRKRSTPPPGFTLLELMTILFILGVLMAIAIPSFSAWLPEYRLKCAVRELYSNMQFARMTSIRASSTRIWRWPMPMWRASLAKRNAPKRHYAVLWMSRTWPTPTGSICISSWGSSWMQWVSTTRRSVNSVRATA